MVHGWNGAITASHLHAADRDLHEPGTSIGHSLSSRKCTAPSDQTVLARAVALADHRRGDPGDDRAGRNDRAFLDQRPARDDGAAPDAAPSMTTVPIPMRLW